VAGWAPDLDAVVRRKIPGPCWESNPSIGKNQSDAFPIQNGLKQDALSPLLFNLVLEDAVGRFKEIRRNRTE
jgi:hypothetical protein